MEMLNEGQRKAVEAGMGPVLVVAGAGTGKTRVLANRIAYLISQKKVEPGKIAALTFTNRAAREMKERIRGMLGEESGIRDVFAGTFHALGKKIINREYCENFTLISEQEKQKVIKQLGGNVRKIHFSHLKETLYCGFFNQEDEQWRELVKGYEETLKKNYMFDFDDLIIQPYLFLKHNVTLLKKYQNMFEYFLIDEFQDINAIQYAFIKLLAVEKNNIFAVGDADQSIYSFRGSEVQNFLSFEKDFEDVKVIRLEENYRSTKNIISFSNHIIKQNKHRIEKSLWTNSQEGTNVQMFEFPTEKWEAKFVSTEIEKIMGGSSHYAMYSGNIGNEEEHTYKFSDIAVLYRLRALGRQISEEMDFCGIPNRIVDQKLFFQYTPMNEIMQYMRLIANPHDDAGFEHIVNFPARNIGLKTIEFLKEYALEKRVSLYEALLMLRNNSSFKNQKVEKLNLFLLLLTDVSKRAKNLHFIEWILYLLNKLKLHHAFEEEGAYCNHKLYFQEFMAIAVRFQDLVAYRAIPQFLQDLTTYDTVDRYNPLAQTVSLMTLHSAKGLEFPIVFILGCEEGIIPYTYHEEDIEEERRIFYVGITRSKEKLYLLSSKERFLFGENRRALSTSFLKDVPMELVNTELDKEFAERMDKPKKDERQLSLF